MKKIYLFFLLLTTLWACRKENYSTYTSGPTTNLDKRSVGVSAKEMLAAATYTRLRIEIQYAPGMKPQDQSVNNLVSFLNAYLNKPGGITVTTTQGASVGKSVITTPDITNFADNNRSFYTDGDHLSLYILFADADYTEAGVLGVSFRNTAICILAKTIQSRSGGFNQVSRVKVESGVMMHEVGHLLGLVNIGSPMITPHEDASHKAHCTNAGCLMYYSVQTTGLFNMLDNTIPSLDANCTSDLRGNGGK